MKTGPSVPKAEGPISVPAIMAPWPAEPRHSAPQAGEIKATFGRAAVTTRRAAPTAVRASTPGRGRGPGWERDRSARGAAGPRARTALCLAGRPAEDPPGHRRGGRVRPGGEHPVPGFRDPGVVRRGEPGQLGEMAGGAQRPIRLGLAGRG